MSATSKFVYAIIVLVIIAAGAIVWRYHRKAQSRMDQEQSTSAQSPQSSNSQASSGCPNGQDVNSTDPVTGRFKPTIDISNKTVTLQTSMGNIIIELYDKDAPKTVENFICLAEKGYYNNVIFHRVAHGFVIQGGDPTGTGSGGQSIYGSPFEDELYPDTPSYQAGYLKGVVAMANSGANTNGSQFFIMLADHPELPHNYTIFGKVISGQDVVDKIGSLPVTPVFGPDDGAPTQKVYIQKAVVGNAKN